jgi:hypothetical protein
MNTVWKIANAKRTVPTGLVIEVVYIVNVSLEGKDDRHVGIVTLEGDEKSPSFVPFEQLTEPIIIGWVKEKLGAEEVTKIESNLQTRILERVEKEKNPEFINGLPWNK